MPRARVGDVKERFRAFVRVGVVARACCMASLVAGGLRRSGRKMRIAVANRESTTARWRSQRANFAQPKEREDVYKINRYESYVRTTFRHKKLLTTTGRSKGSRTIPSRDLTMQAKPRQALTAQLL